MTIYPFFNLFMSTLLLSTVLALMVNHWVFVWLFLELNMISFIPIINASNWNQEQEACLKYLLFQALGSSLLLLSATNILMQPFTCLALFIKLGVAPFHFWFPSVMKSTSWVPSTLLLTWQKVAPMSLLLLSTTQPMIVMLTGGLSALVGGIGGMSQTHFRALLAYSSIGHMGWMISSIIMSPSTAMFYLAFYLLLSLTIMVISASTNTTILQTTKKNTTTPMFLCLAFLLLSLSGLPPFAGFLPKIMVLSSMKSFFLPLVLILGSIMNLYYYLNFILVNLTSTYMKPYRTWWSFPHSLAVYISVCPLPFLIITPLLI